MAKGIRLFQAQSFFAKFGDMENVHFTWVRLGGKVRFDEKDYRELISNYSSIEESQRIYPESAIDNWFTADEIKILREVLKESFNADLEVLVEHQVPFDDNCMGTSCLPYGNTFPKFFFLDFPKEVNIPFEFGGLLVDPDKAENFSIHEVGEEKLKNWPFDFDCRYLFEENSSHNVPF